MGRKRVGRLKSDPVGQMRQIAAPDFRRASPCCAPVHHFRIFFCLLLATACGLRSGAAELVSGAAVIDYDEAAWNALAAATGQPQPVLRLDAVFNQAEAAAATYDELLRAPKPGASYLGQTYAMNGGTVTNLPQRTAQPTTFAWEPGDLPGHTGVIGLGGVARFAVSGGGVLLYGDFTLLYSSARLARGGSGWFLRGNIPPAAAAFDLLNPVLTETATGFTLAGDLGVSFEVANFLYATPADTLRVVGRFQFTGSSVVQATEPPVLELGGWTADTLQVAGKGGTPNGDFTVQATPTLGAGGPEWSAVATGRFDAEGRFSLNVSNSVGTAERWFRIIIP